MARSLSELIREGLDEALGDSCAGEALASAQTREPALGGLALQEMTLLIHRRSVPACRQDDVMAAAIRCYRSGQRGIWAAVLLSMLAPAVIATAARVRCGSPDLDGEELDQQVVAEVLRACAEIPLPDSCRYVQRRVLLLANKRL